MPSQKNKTIYEMKSIQT